MSRQRRTAVSLVLVGIVCWAGGNLSSGPSPAAKEAESPKSVAPSATRVAVVDLARVFRVDTKFNRLNERLKTDLAEAEKGLFDRKNSLEQRKAETARLRRGGGDYKRRLAEEEIASAILETDSNGQKASFMSREAKIYGTVFNEINSEVERYCHAHGVQLVIRSAKETMDMDDPQSILKAINVSVLYDDGIDITDDILAALNSRPDRQVD